MIKNFSGKRRTLRCGVGIVLLASVLGCSPLIPSPAPLTTTPPAVSPIPVQNPTEVGPTPTTVATENREPVLTADATDMSEPPETTVRAREIAFTGYATDLGYDSDRNGLFEFLEASVEVDVIKAGRYFVTTALTALDGSLVAVGGLTPDPYRAAPVTSAVLDPGVQAIVIYFDGRSIRSFGADGPYTLNVMLSDATGSLTRIDLVTQRYNHADFQSSLIEVQDVRDSGVNTDTIPGYNLLRVATDIVVTAAGSVTVQGQLFAGSTFLADVTQTCDLKSGSQTVDLDFSSMYIAGSGADGPYTVYLSFSDAYSSGNRTFDTKAYQHQEFQMPGALFTGSMMDGGVDSNGNGLFEQLYVQAELVATTPGRFTIVGVLKDAAGHMIHATEKQADLETTPVEVVLHFDGATISHRGADGPYQVLLTITDADENDLMHQEYTTSAYGSGDFESK